MIERSTKEEHDGLSHVLVENHEWAWRFALVLWALAGLLFVAVAIPPVRDVIFSFDEFVYDTTYPIKVGLLTGAAWVLNFIGGGLFAWPFRLLITAVLAVKRRWEAVAAWLLALALSEPFIWILKNVYGRERPPQALVETTSGSFPSGHAIGGAVMAVGLVVAFVPAGPERRNLEVLAAAFAFVMGGSRIYLGAHYVTDVVAGVAFGAAAAIGAAVIVHRYFVKRAMAGRAEALRILEEQAAAEAPG